ncbi:MAG: cadherin-like beta sandwich domain-containing protein [Clostridia bacterium]|nr:cadherin-like beta sandwich domain-containing protein [Clostridia bacterium]
MKIQKKIRIITVLSIVILVALLTNKNYAVNETNEETANNNTNTNQQADNTTDQNTNQNTQNSSNSTNTNSNTNSNARNTTNNNTTTTKSNNANLADLGIKPHDFKGFRYGTTSYEVVVPEETESIEVYAKTQDSKATLTGTGKKTLEKGENKLDVEVTAEDGTKKTYTINVIREVMQEGSENGQTDKGEGLAELKINDLNLSPKFSTNVYEYNVKYIGEDDKLNITAEPTNKDYAVEITGNDNLKEGENIITILVSNKNGDNIATYQITVDKSLVDEEAIKKEEAEKAKQQNIIIGAVIVAVIIVAIIVFIIIRRRRGEDLEYDDTYDDYADEEDEIEIPKALKKKSKNVKEENNEEDEIENLPKEKLKEKFLNNYSNYEEDYEINYNSPRKKDKPKGKRFKE